MRLDIDSLETKVKNGEKEKLIMGQDMQEMKMKMIYIEKENQEMKEEIKMLKTEMEFMGNQGHGNNSGTDLIEMKLEDGQEKITAAEFDYRKLRDETKTLNNEVIMLKSTAREHEYE